MISKSSNRQDVICGIVDFTYDDFVDGVFQGAVELPQDGEVVGGGIAVDEAFNSTTSDTGTVGDSDTGDRYASGVDFQATGRTALTLTGYKMTAPGDVGITLTSVGGPPTQGKGRLLVEYVVHGRAHFSQG